MGKGDTDHMIAPRSLRGLAFRLRETGLRRIHLEAIVGTRARDGGDWNRGMWDKVRVCRV